MDRLVVFGDHEEGTLKQIRTCLELGGEYAVLCADGHKGYAQPIGGVIAYKNKISLSGVGYDIGCGNLACRTDLAADDLRHEIEPIMDEIVRRIVFGVGGRSRDDYSSHEIFDDPRWRIPILSNLKKLAQEELGTVGSSNHYVDLFIDEGERVWVGVHFGSRGFGHHAATEYLRLAGGRDGMNVPPTVVEADSPLGSEYLEAMRLAGHYAFVGRELVARKVVKDILQANVVDEVHNHHNFAWQERHFGEEYWVVRKGATPAFPGQRGFVGGSMGDNAVILEGVDSELSQKALYSTIHGAGRIMSRTEAAGRVRFRGGQKHHLGGGKITRQMMMEWVHEKGVTLRGGGTDESPHVYRRLQEVLDAHAGTIRILHTLRPIGVAMAGD
jgi:tRNA-splicing ligase RtcB (3'-phosphate/5'-hydroxy nucleic acid ligase)